MRKRVLVIIKASQQQEANQNALQYDPVGGARTFTVGLSYDGTPPATHYWASASVDLATFAAIQTLVAQSPGAVLEEYDQDADPDFPDTLLEAQGLKRVRT